MARKIYSLTYVEGGPHAIWVRYYAHSSSAVRAYRAWRRRLPDATLFVCSRDVRE